MRVRFVHRVVRGRFTRGIKTLPQRRLGKDGPLTSCVGIGAMGLGLAGCPSERDALAVLHAAFDAGITHVDTADVYCTDDSDVGKNEKLVRKALDTYHHAQRASEVVVATKGIMRRPGGRWEASSDPEDIFTACDRSLDALGVDCIDLYYLHSVSGFDDRLFARTVNNLRILQSEKKIRHIGLSNVSLSQLTAAQAVVQVSAVQNRCNWLDSTAFQNGIVSHCKDTEVAFVPYSPVGGFRGHRTASERPELQIPMARLGCSAHEVMLSWLLQIDDTILPIPGATKVETVHSIARAASLGSSLSDTEIIELYHAGAKVGAGASE